MIWRLQQALPVRLLLQQWHHWCLHIHLHTNRHLLIGKNSWTQAFSPGLDIQDNHSAACRQSFVELQKPCCIAGIHTRKLAFRFHLFHSKFGYSVSNRIDYIFQKSTLLIWNSAYLYCLSQAKNNSHRSICQHVPLIESRIIHNQLKPDAFLSFIIFSGIHVRVGCFFYPLLSLLTNSHIIYDWYF